MDKLSNRMVELREHVSPDWSDVRAEALLREIRQRQSADQQQRRRSTVFLGLTGAVTACLALFISTSSTGPSALNGQSASGGDAASTKGVVVAAESKSQHLGHEQARYFGAGRIALADGSSAQTFADSELAVFGNTADDVQLTVVQGAVRFEVVKRSAREFSVHAGNITVTVLGTVFEVAHTDVGIRVGVERGRVQVTRGAETYFVATGQQLLVPPTGEAHSTPVEAKVELEDATPGQASQAATDAATNGLADVSAGVRPKTGRTLRTSPRSHAPKPNQPNAASSNASEWRALAKAGDYRAAYRAIRKRNALTRRWDANSLLDAADAARFSGHPAAAIAYLEQVTKQHPASPMAPLAAFTLGRVCLDQLGHPHQAAAAFALALELAPYGSLAQDALARQVEALSKGGRDAKAFKLARAYIQKYPRGRRLHAVRKYGGVE